MPTCNTKKIGICQSAKKLCNPDTGRCVKGRNNKKKLTAMYQDYTVVQLKDLAKQLGVRGYSGKTKAQIINLLVGTRLTKRSPRKSPRRSPKRSPVKKPSPPRQLLKVDYTEMPIDEDEMIQFQYDMGDGNYEEWVQRFPEYLYSIFGALIDFNGEPTLNDIKFFTKRGLNLDEYGPCYHGDMGYNSPLQFACEKRNRALVKVLLEAGADPNGRIPGSMSDGDTPIMACLFGELKPAYYPIIIELIKLLVSYGAKPVISREWTEQFKYPPSIMNLLRVE